MICQSGNVWKKESSSATELYQLGIRLDNCLADDDSRYFNEGVRGDMEYWVLYVNDAPEVIVGCHVKTSTVSGLKGKSGVIPMRFKTDICELLDVLQATHRIVDIHLYIQTLGVICINGKWIPADEIPDNTTVNHSLNLNNYRIRKLPENLTVNGSLHLCKTRVTSLPESLRVRDYIDVRFTEITIPKQNDKILNNSEQIRTYHLGEHNGSKRAGDC